MSTRFTLITLLILISTTSALARVISNSGTEATYSYKAKFRSLVLAEGKESYTPEKEAEFHAAHLFGLFHNNEYAKNYTESFDLNQGFAGNKFTQIKSAHFIKEPNDEYLWVEYQATGQMIVNNYVLNGWLNGSETATVQLKLLSDLTAIYMPYHLSEDNYLEYAQKKWRFCTDKYYWGAADFSYFYNPYECPELYKSPISKPTEFKIKKINSSNTKMPLKKLRSDNGNGNLTVAYFTFGFDHTPPSGSSQSEIRRDASWKLYKNLERELLKSHGFKKISGLPELRKTLGTQMANLELQSPVALEHDDQRRYYSTFIRQDEKQTWVVRTALFDTKNSPDSIKVSFPKFWKEAWENGDFIYYGGHSGDGVSLNLSTMLDHIDRAGLSGIHFPQEKMQVAFLDACSTYSHYVDNYTEQKPKNLHIMSFGLVSLFETAKQTMSVVLSTLFDSTQNDIGWNTFLKQIEDSHLKPVLGFWGGKMDYMEPYYRERGFAPSLLLNVHVP